MKKKIIIITSILLAAAIAAVLVIVFVNSGTSSPDVATNGATIDSAKKVSTIEDGVAYKLVSVTQDGKDTSATIALLEKAGVNVTLVKNGDTVTMLDEAYSIVDGNIFDTNDRYFFTVENGRITVDNRSGEIMIFEKQK